MRFSRDKAFYARVFRLTGFIALQNVTVCMVGLIDNVMIGAYSQEALAGIAWPIRFSLCCKCSWAASVKEPRF